MSSSTSIYRYWPNRVGYIRIILLFGGIACSREAPGVASLFFFINLILDSVDGFLARKLKQETRFGAMLDYVIDRASCVSYGMILSILFPSWLILWALLVNLDLASHFFHLKASEGKESHKTISSEEPFWVRLYYKRIILGLTCLLHDLFFISLYFHTYYPSLFTTTILLISLPGALFKTIVHGIQLVRASRRLAK